VEQFGVTEVSENPTSQALPHGSVIPAAIY
jgi:hypothetical protein